MSGPNLKKHVSPHGQVTAVSMMKDEAPFLLEWFAHHLAVGFTDILVYTNDCSDGTDDMLIRLEELGLGHHRRNDIPEGVKPQPSAIKYAQQEPVVQNSDWVILFDADEFLSINYGDGKIDSMITAAGDADGIVITWRTFGSGGVVEWSSAPVTEQYLYAAPHSWNKGWGVKTLFRFDPEHWKLGIHRPKMKGKTLKTDYPDSIQWLNGSGEPMEDYFKYRGWRSIKRTVGFNWSQMNHYAIKSIDSYAIRKFRGNVNNKKDKYNADYWSLQDRNEVKDTAILRYSEERTRIMAELLKDPILNKLHFAAIERIEARLAEYKKTEAYTTLRDSLISASNVPITQVVAKPPKARDPKQIAALMSEISKNKPSKPPAQPNNRAANSSDIYRPAPLDFSQDLPMEVVDNHGITIGADPRVFTNDTVEDIAQGKFQRKEARLRGMLLTSADRLLELGSGVGFLAMVSCKAHSGLTALGFEARADLRAIASKIAKANALSDRFSQVAPAQDAAIKMAAFEPTAVFLNGKFAPEDFQTLCAIPSITRIILASARIKSHQRAEIMDRTGFRPNELSDRCKSRVFDRNRGTP